jgi:hypothetical protein
MGVAEQAFIVLHIAEKAQIVFIDVAINEHGSIKKFSKFEFCSRVNRHTDR